MRGSLNLPTVVLIFLAAFNLASAPLSAELEPTYPVGTAVCPDSLLRTCRDAYCSKPQPCIACGVVRSTACYCPKPQPCVECFQRPFAPRTYCPKPLPHLCPPIFAEYFRCVPTVERSTPTAEPRAD